MADSVSLRDVTEDDLPIFFAFQLDEEANRLAAFTPRDEASFMAHWRRNLSNPANDTQTIVCDGRVVGNIAAFEWDGPREVGYWIGREFWGRGIATRALALFLTQVATRPLYAHVATHNIASRRVLEKCGFIVSGYDAAFVTLNGEPVAGIVLKLDATPGETGQ